MAEKGVRARMAEERLIQLMLTTCDHMGASSSSSGNGHHGHGEEMNGDDAVMICRRVVTDFGDDVIDALSTGEDPNGICKELGACPKSRDGIRQDMEVAAAFRKHQQQQQQQAGAAEEDQEQRQARRKQKSSAATTSATGGNEL